MTNFWDKLNELGLEDMLENGKKKLEKARTAAETELGKARTVVEAVAPLVADKFKAAAEKKINDLSAQGQKTATEMYDAAMAKIMQAVQSEGAQKMIAGGKNLANTVESALEDAEARITPITDYVKDPATQAAAKASAAKFQKSVEGFLNQLRTDFEANRASAIEQADILKEVGGAAKYIAIIEANVNDIQKYSPEYMRRMNSVLWVIRTQVAYQLGGTYISPNKTDLEMMANLRDTASSMDTLLSEESKNASPEEKDRLKQSAERMVTLCDQLYTQLDEIAKADGKKPVPDELKGLKTYLAKLDL